MKKLQTIIVPIILAVICLLVLSDILRSTNTNFWDFKVYYYAAKVFVSGGDPYSIAELSTAAHEPIRLPYVYPPIVTPLFIPFILFPIKAAALIFLIFKLFLLGILVFLWFTFFSIRPDDIAFYIIAILGFSCCIFRDLQTGNISIIEQLILWSGLVCFLRGKENLFYAIIVLLATIKLTPLLFLFLPLVLRRDKALFKIGLCFLVFAFIWGIQFLAMPRLFTTYVHIASSIDERGSINPSSLALIRDFADAYIPLSSYILNNILSSSLYIIYSGLILFYFLNRTNDSNIPLEEFIFLFCLFYATIVPRFKDYAYILLVPSLYYVYRRTTIPKTAILLLILLYNDIGIPFVPYFSWTHFFFDYNSFFVTLIIFIVALEHIHSTKLSTNFPSLFPSSPL